MFLEDSQLTFSSQNICQIKAVNITTAMPWSSFIFLGLFQIYWLLTKFKLIFSGGLTSLIWILMEHLHNFLMEQFKVSQMEVRNFLASKYDYLWNYIFFFLLGLLCVTCTDMVRSSFLFPKYGWFYICYSINFRPFYVEMQRRHATQSMEQQVLEEGTVMSPHFELF